MSATPAAVITELESSLQALLALKPPGVTKNRISSITNLCVENVKSESVLVQKIYTHFKKAPGTHKLGVLYVIDSVTRQWLAKANSLGEDLTTDSPPDGTYAAGHQKVKELLPLMINSWLANGPADQKDKMLKLLDIWERGDVFPDDLISEFKKKVEQREEVLAESAPIAEQAESQPINRTAAIELPQSSTHPSVAVAGAANASNLPSQPSLPNTSGQSTTTPSHESLIRFLTERNNNAPIPPEVMNALAPFFPPHVLSDPAAVERTLNILKTLAQNGIPVDQWKAVIDAVSAQSQPPPQAPPAQAFAQPPNQSNAQSQQQQHYSNRGRSRSPPRRRNSPVYGQFEANSYRERSPRRGESPPKQFDTIIGDPEPKEIGYDPSVPNGHIKVLSRTLFIGGTTAGMDELTEIFSQFGKVQSCIPNADKRHAFIKYCRREGATHAIDSWRTVQDPHLTNTIRSVKWGVGFGPRECNDFTTGVSIIPIHKLTEADRKWVLTAPYGGTGGKEFSTGTVMEEPDIEIGQGVSSKAISRRLGDHETNRRPRGGAQPDYNRRSRSDQEQPPPHQYQPQSYPMPPLPGQRYDAALPPAVPGFGFYPPHPSGMPPYG